MAARGEAQADVEVSTLVVPAWRLRWRAPELALVLGERAVALASARRDEVDRLRAEALVIFASNRMGRGVKTADRALDALKAAEAAGERETAWRLRVELADSARSVGAPLTGFAAVRPVLEADDVPPGLRASALVQAGECLVSVGRGAALGQALDEADRLYQADPLLDHDTTILHRGLLRAAAAGQHRRWGDLPQAIVACREGLALLDGLREAESDNGQVRGRLTVELVCALLDSNQGAEASRVGTPLLERPVRAPSAATAGWLRLALATRVHLPAGRVDQARDLLRDVADSAERHQLDTLQTESFLALAHVHEVSGDLTEALANLRAAHAAERRRARAVYAVRARLAAEFSGIHRQSAGSLHEQLATLLRTGTPTAPPAPDTTTPAPEVGQQQLRQWRPVQVHRNEGLRVKRSRRAAEDMTVEGISAARAHAADRWRLVHPFGEQGEQGEQGPQGQPDHPGGQGDQVQDTSKPTGRRRAPDAVPGSRSREPLPFTQGRPEHARSIEAKPTALSQPLTPPGGLNLQPPAAPAPGGRLIAPTPGPASATAGPLPTAAGPTAAEPAATTAAPAAPVSGPAASAVEPSAPTSGPAAPASGLPAPDFGSNAPVPDPVVPTSGPVMPGSGLFAPAVGPAFPPSLAPPSVTPPVPVPPVSAPPGPVLPAPVLPAPVLPNPVLPSSILSSPILRGPFPPEPAPAAATDPVASPPDGPSPSVQAGADASTAPSSGEPFDLSLPTALDGAGWTDGEDTSADTAPTAKSGGDRTVPAAGLIAAAGAVRSGRRRAAREATEETPDQSAEQAGESSSVLDSLKAAGLLDPPRGGGRRRAPDGADGITGAPATAEPATAGPVTATGPGAPASGVAGSDQPEVVDLSVPAVPDTDVVEPGAGEPVPTAGPEVVTGADAVVEQVQWRVEPPARFRVEEPVDMFDSPTMVQPAIRDDVPPVGLGAAFVKGPVIPTARVPEPPDFASVPSAFPMHDADDVPVEVEVKTEIKPESAPASGAPGEPASPAVVDEPRPVQEPVSRPEPRPEPRPLPASLSLSAPLFAPSPTPASAPPESASELTSILKPVFLPEPAAAPDLAPEPEPEAVPAPAPAPTPAPTPAPEPEPAPEPVAAPEPEPAPTPPTPSTPKSLDPTGFLGAADVEDDSAEEPFIRSVVVGGRTIDLPPISKPIQLPSTTRAERRPKSDLSLAELLAEALVAYEDARREDEAAGWTDEMDQDVPADPAPRVAQPDRVAHPAHAAPADDDTVPIPPVPPVPPDASVAPVATAPRPAPVRPPDPDNETTGPIRRVDPPRFDTWTLPES
ncbi:hypothetical protein Q5530_15565 [Saccharothrix sp. BKS2]|uniref:hypothetical protein n=1 Tax=Saccharothrix sp. BKS2 TaxID=3064400 RepID=UPI0039E783B3